MAKRLRYAIINHERHTVRDLIEEDVSLAREYSRRYHSNMVVDYIEANGDDVEGVEDIFDAMETYRKYRNRLFVGHGEFDEHENVLDYAFRHGYVGIFDFLARVYNVDIENEYLSEAIRLKNDLMLEYIIRQLGPDILNYDPREKRFLLRDRPDLPNILSPMLLKRERDITERAKRYVEDEESLAYLTLNVVSQNTQETSLRGDISPFEI